MTVVHLWLAAVALPPRLGAGAAERIPRRIAVDFVRQLEPAAPPPRPPAPPRRPRRTVRRLAAGMPALAASAAQAEEPLAPVAEVTVPDLTEVEAPPPLAALAASAATAQAFEWPPSTRLRYHLTGNYRGPVEGQASVEWLRSGSHYQVLMDVVIGAPFAPLITREVSSIGEITPDGLRPVRYDEDTRVVLHAPRHLTVFLDRDRVRLANGSAVPRPPGVQDSASQFVQLTWLFTTRPELLQAGQSIALPLALARKVEPWTYDVLAGELLATTAGPVEAAHVKPRREPEPGGDLIAEMWVAPSLQYLPVRILIRQDAETYVDLTIDRLPEQAAPGR